MSVTVLFKVAKVVEVVYISPLEYVTSLVV